MAKPKYQLKYAAMADILAQDAPPSLPDFPELAAGDPAGLIEAIRNGLPAERFDALQNALDVPIALLTEVLNISTSTLSRRRRQGRFEQDESERLVRIGRLAAYAVEVLDGLENARKWLTEPLRAIGGEIPLRYASVEPGAREVERVLGRLEHGVYS